MASCEKIPLWAEWLLRKLAAENMALDAELQSAYDRLHDLQEKYNELFALTADKLPKEEERTD